MKTKKLSLCLLGFTYLVESKALLPSVCWGCGSRGLGDHARWSGIHLSRPPFHHAASEEFSPAEDIPNEADQSLTLHSSELVETRWLNAPRIFVEHGDLSLGRVVPLSPPQAQYLVSVMRLRDGDFVRIFDGVSGEYSATLRGVTGQGGRGAGRNRATPRDVELIVDTLIRQQPPTDADPSGVALFFAPIRKQRLKQLVEKAAEIGVTSMTPVLTARTQASSADAAMLSKLIPTAVEAAEQSERMTVPHVRSRAIALSQLLKDWGGEGGKEQMNSPVGGARLLFVCKERDANASPILEALADAEGKGGADDSRSSPIGCGKVAFLVGPEGGFEPTELEMMAGHTFVRFVSLGPTVLRAETAAMYALSCWSAFSESRRSVPG